MKAAIMVIRNITLLSCLWVSLLFCTKKTSQDPVPPFESTPQSFAVNLDLVKEASGIAGSKTNPGFLWVQQDSGNPTSLALLKQDGSQVQSVHLNNCSNRDWEEMALSTGPVDGKWYLYIAETGDNLQQQDEYAFYRLEEPAAGIAEVQDVDKITFTYPDGSHDSEAFLADPASKDLYIITKRDSLSKVYKLSYPYSTSTVNTTTLVATLPFNLVTAAAISPDRKELVIKNYFTLYYYTLSGGENIEQALARKPVILPYVAEPQGEAITFATDNKGFYTLSEKLGNLPQMLNFYKRK